MASCPGAGVAAPVRHHATTSHDIKFASRSAYFCQNIIDEAFSCLAGKPSSMTVAHLIRDHAHIEQNLFKKLNYVVILDKYV